jgi:hypothetical protein
MSLENDPNVIYGGELIDTPGPISEMFASLGELIFEDLKMGENRTNFVSFR